MKLKEFEKNVFSQKGEDGVIGKICQLINLKDDFCVEFGAWDGVHLSNIKNLIESGWSGLFIEANPIKFVELKNNYKDNPRVICLNKFVNFEGSDTLDIILEENNFKKDFGLLSIDIDGNDYHIWSSLNKFQPKIIVIEYNPSIPPHIEFVQEKDLSKTHGNSLKSLCLLGKQKGYELVHVTSLNAIFVRKDLFPIFNIIDNSPEKMFGNKGFLLEVFQLYDGTLVFQGNKKAAWHGVKIKDNFQIIPKIFREFPDNMNPIKKFFFRIWKKYKNL